MKATTRFASIWMFLAHGAILVGCFLALSTQLNAQCSGTQGQNGVYNPTCNGGSPGVVGSSAFIDASMFIGSASANNICAVLNWVLNPANRILPAAGAVIDARGLNSGNTSMACIGIVERRFLTDANVGGGFHGYLSVGHFISQPAS
jgi:hypothetical protein